MTPIRRPVFRLSSSTMHDTGRRRAIAVGILPGDVLEFRLKGTRRRFILGIGQAMQYALRLHADQVRAERARARKMRREGRQ